MNDHVAKRIEAGAVQQVGRYRWMIVALLFAATVINYVDRQMIGVLKPVLSEDLKWWETDFANVILFFQFAYAIGYIGFGRIVDVIGARFGYAIAFIIWQVAHIAHGGAYFVTQFAMARFGLGLGESGNFPAGITRRVTPKSRFLPFTAPIDRALSRCVGPCSPDRRWLRSLPIRARNEPIIIRERRE